MEWETFISMMLETENADEAAVCERYPGEGLCNSTPYFQNITVEEVSALQQNESVEELSLSGVKCQVLKKNKYKDIFLKTPVLPDDTQRDIVVSMSSRKILIARGCAGVAVEELERDVVDFSKYLVAIEQ